MIVHQTAALCAGAEIRHPFLTHRPGHIDFGIVSGMVNGQGHAHSLGSDKALTIAGVRTEAQQNAPR